MFVSNVVFYCESYSNLAVDTSNLSEKYTLDKLLQLLAEKYFSNIKYDISFEAINNNQMTIRIYENSVLILEQTVNKSDHNQVRRRYSNIDLVWNTYDNSWYFEFRADGYYAKKSDMSDQVFYSENSSAYIQDTSKEIVYIKWA